VDNTQLGSDLEAEHMGFWKGRSSAKPNKRGPFPGELLQEGKPFSADDLTEHDREYLARIWPMFTGKVEGLTDAWIESGQMWLLTPAEMLQHAQVVAGVVYNDANLIELFESITAGEAEAVAAGIEPTLAHAQARMKIEMAIQTVEVYLPEKRHVVNEVRGLHEGPISTRRPQIRDTEGC
jgi:hypothetical protein